MIECDIEIHIPIMHKLYVIGRMQTGHGLKTMCGQLVTSILCTANVYAT